MVDPSTFVAWLAAWVVCLLFTLWHQRKEWSGAGLVISYVLQLWVTHWLAASIYAFPWYIAPDQMMLDGLKQSTYAIAGFAVGSSILAPYFLRPPSADTRPRRIKVEGWLVHAYLIIGALAYFVWEPMLHGIPTVSAIVSGAGNLLIVALAMECWNSLGDQFPPRRTFGRWLLLSMLLPFMTIVTKGYLGYGFAAMLTVFSFVASFYRPRWKIVVSAMVVGYLALSVYVTYMRDRREIRRVVWGQEAYSDRLSRMAETFRNFEFLDLTNPDHLVRIDERLNQDVLVGMAVNYLEKEPEQAAHGRTLWDAVYSLIPRALWRNKPMVAGSSDVVTEYTGLRFGEDTSVGIGHVMEWYVNFMSLGVFFGMALTGLVIGYIDRVAMMRLGAGDWLGFALWWMPGLSLLQVGGSLVDCFSSAGAGLVVAAVIYQYLQGRWRGQAAPRLEPASVTDRPRMVRTPSGNR